MVGGGTGMLKESQEKDGWRGGYRDVEGEPGEGWLGGVQGC